MNEFFRTRDQDNVQYIFRKDAVQMVINTVPSMSEYDGAEPLGPEQINRSTIRIKTSIGTEETFPSVHDASYLYRKIRY